MDTDTKVQKKRHEAAMKVLALSVAYQDNELEIPEVLPRFLGTEETEESPMWAYFEDCIEAIGANFEDSDTTGVSRWRVHDLDTGAVHVPVFSITDFIEIPQE